MKKKRSQAPLFVGIDSPREIRKSLLEASKGILESLQKYERFRVIREKKLLLVTGLRRDIASLNKLMNALKRDLPSVTMKAEPIRKKIVKRTKGKAMMVTEEQKPARPARHDVQIEPEKPRTELDRLEEELADIENRLNIMG